MFRNDGDGSASDDVRQGLGSAHMVGHAEKQLD